MTLFLIPARAGSKRLKRKNRLPFCGLPLWMWSYATAMRVKSPADQVVVSTDDEDILRVASVLGPHGFRRPAHLCSDESPTQDLIDWTFEWATVEDSICLLQATSPTRSDALVRGLLRHGGSVCSATNGVADGMCYIYKRGVPVMGLVESCYSAIDIDTLEDFQGAERSMMEKFK